MRRCLFLRSVHTFRDFRSQIDVMMLVTPKLEVERKGECICDVKFLTLILKWGGKTMFRQKLTCGKLTTNFTVSHFFYPIFL